MSELGAATARGSYSDRTSGATGAGSVIGAPIDYFAVARALRCSSLTTHQRAVVGLSLALRANLEGVAWPEAITIAGDTGMSRRGAQYVLQELEALGVLVRVPWPARSNAWVISVDRIYEITPAQVREARAAVRAHVVRSSKSAPGATKSAPGATKSAPGAPDQPRSTSDQPRSPSGGGEGEKDEKKKGRKEAINDAIDAVWTAYRALHPRCGSAPPGGDRRLIEGRLREAYRDVEDWQAAAADVIDVIESHHKSDEAAWFQGANPDGRIYLGVETLLKSRGWSSRLELARRWREAGRPVAKREAPGAKAAAEKAWGYLASLVRSGARGLPEDLAEKVGTDKAAALQAGLATIGGWTAYGRLRSAEERGAQADFTASFVAELTARVLG